MKIDGGGYIKYRDQSLGLSYSVWIYEPLSVRVVHFTGTQY